MPTSHASRLPVPALVAVFVALSAPAALAQDGNFYVVSKGQGFLQTSATGAVADPHGSFGFGVGAPTNVTLTLPAGATQALTILPGDKKIDFSQTFATKAALDAAFPNGTYRLAGTGIPALSYNLTTDSYPAATPQVTGGNWNAGGVLVVDPTQASTINFSAFTGYGSSGVAAHIEFRIDSLTDNGDLGLENQATSVALGGSPAAPAFASFVIPAGKLISGHVYEGDIEFDTITTVDTTSVPGGAAVALWQKSLKFYIAAQAAGTAPLTPAITTQPTNQTVPAGGRVTISLGVSNVPNPGPNVPISILWNFNGRNIFADGGKYGFAPGFGLIINNVTAQDAGTYYVTIITAGGVITSNSVTLTVGPAATTGPTFVLQPTSQTVGNGNTVIFMAGATNATGFTWTRDGNPVPNSNGPLLVLSGPQNVIAGSYRAVATNTAGTTTSDPATLTVTSFATDGGKLLNLSILTPLAAGETMTMGTVLGGAFTTGNKPLLARAAGPSLAQVGVTGFLPDPTMILTNTSTNTVVATNNDWGGDASLSAAFSAVGAFAYSAPNSGDAAIFQPSLPPASYTVQVRDSGSGTGTVIAELYDSTPTASFNGQTPRLINVSVLKTIANGASLTAGFFIGGPANRTVLIRAVGPTLGAAPFNIGGAMADPQLTLFNGNQAVVATNNDWGGNPQIANLSDRVGAFALVGPTSRDAVLPITLAPGSYTVNVSGVGGTGGTAIVEVYEVQ